MKSTDFKISIEKSWGFTCQVLILIILGIVAVIGFLVLIWQLLKPASQPSPAVVSPPSAAPKTNMQIPEGPIYGVLGKITSISEQHQWVGIGEKEEVIAVIVLHWDLLNKDYQFQVNDETLVNSYTNSSETDLPKLLEENIGWNSLKVDDQVYIDSLLDLMGNNIIPPRAIKDINIYTAS